MRPLSVRDLARTVGRRGVRLPLVVGVIGILALSAGMVYAAIPNSGTGVINGCFEKYTGLLRVIDVEAGKSCTRWETPISWSQVGPRGATGAQGPAGADGLRGADGAIGPQGPAGNDGATGAQGQAGAAGADGTDGADGTSVLSGPEAPEDAIGMPGDFYLDTTESVLYGPKTDEGWEVGVLLVGPQGQAGATGATGATGSVGATGATGLQGPAGATGATGPQGPAGPAGSGVSGWEVVIAGNASGNIAAIAVCPAGKHVLGGGFRSDWLDFRPVRSFPDGLSRWIVADGNGLGSQMPANTFSAYAICADI